MLDPDKYFPRPKKLGAETITSDTAGVYRLFKKMPEPLISVEMLEGGCRLYRIYGSDRENRPQV